MGQSGPQYDWFVPAGKSPWHTEPGLGAWESGFAWARQHSRSHPPKRPLKKGEANSVGPEGPGLNFCGPCGGYVGCRLGGGGHACQEDIYLSGEKRARVCPVQPQAAGVGGQATRGWWPYSAHPFQWVLAFEIFIPLVLFFILLGLRQKKPTISVKEGECPWVGGGGNGGPRAQLGGQGWAGSPRCITRACPGARDHTRVPAPTLSWRGPCARSPAWSLTIPPGWA